MGGGRGGFRGVDEATQRRLNAEAPPVAHLGARTIAMFRPYRGRIVLTGILVVTGAAIGVIPPLLVQQIFDAALFPHGAAGASAPTSGSCGVWWERWSGSSCCRRRSA